MALTEARRQKLASGGRVLRAEAYVIRNGRLDPEWASVERRTLGIAGRAIATMIISAGFIEPLARDAHPGCADR